MKLRTDILKAAQNFYRRPSSQKMITLSSKQGRELFEDCANTGELRMFYRTCEQISTQSDPGSCAPSTISTILNVLGVDPQRQWKGIWRWHDETTILHRPRELSWTLLEAADILRNNNVSLRTMFPDISLNAKLHLKHRMCIYDERRSNYLQDGARCETHPTLTNPSIDALASLRQKQGKQPECVLNTQQLTISRLNLRTFRSLLAFLTRREDMYMIANYHRQALDQTGAGHFSPIGAYNAANNRVLVLDVARFKYGYHWISADDLFNSLTLEDPLTHVSRGLIVLSNQIQIGDGRVRTFHLRHGLVENRHLQMAPILACEAPHESLLTQILAAPFFREFTWKYLLERELARDESLIARKRYHRLREDTTQIANGSSHFIETFYKSPILQDIQEICKSMVPTEQSSVKLFLVLVAARLLGKKIEEPILNSLEQVTSLREELNYIFSFYFNEYIKA